MRQSSCVLVEGKAVLIEGEPGSGKSSLALALIDRGAQLVGDDGVTLARRGETLWASPPPNTAGLIEIRNVGLVEMPAAEGPVALLLTLDPQAPRFVDQAGTIAIGGMQLPQIALFPDASTLPLRAEWAVRKYATAR
ncbi:serine kinase [Alteraurantiacibacter aquimixticola]|uniref:Serine kinase n=1 Tax=Alteraurantiacibacter aquimixticola TaxID=2489173 RepID=A0A4T3F4N0_9SPHN|nr:serine kinase [Alteraurantiacibacter aquimixticola]